MQQISLIAAMATNGVIGKAGRLPWHLPKDLAWFKKQTLNKPIIMGSTTYRSIGRALPGRKNIVLSRTMQPVSGVCVVVSMDAALRQIDPQEQEVMVIGGAKIYEAFLPWANRIYLTRIDAIVAGDVYFPNVDWQQWRLCFEQAHPADIQHRWPLVFQIYERQYGIAP